MAALRVVRRRDHRYADSVPTEFLGDRRIRNPLCEPAVSNPPCRTPRV